MGGSLLNRYVMRISTHSVADIALAGVAKQPAGRGESY